jgi:triple functional domain protein
MARGEQWLRLSRLLSVPVHPVLFISPLQSEGSSSSNISTMLVTHEYTAVKEDEINVYQGEVVQILASNQQNMFLVFRAATDQCPAAEGWIPGFVLGHTSAVIMENPDGTLK